MCADELPSGQTIITPTNAVVSDNKKKIELTATGKYMIINAENNAALNGLMVSISQDDQYEPYHEPQSMSVTTPNGLPGIPVSSGGNYTDEQGQQWICDEVNLERGVYVQRVYSVIVDGIDAAFSQKGPYCNINLRNMPSVKTTSTSSHGAVAKSTFTSEAWSFNPDSGFLYIIKENYDEILNESCKKHNGEVIYALATPIETPLSETDIAAYRALTTYKGTTILESECYLKVKYSKLRK